MHLLTVVVSFEISSYKEIEMIEFHIALLSYSALLVLKCESLSTHFMPLVSFYTS